MLLYFMETIYWQTDTVSYQFANKERFMEEITRSQKTYPAFSYLSLSWFEPLFHFPLYFIYLLFLTTSYYFFLSSSTSSSYHCLHFLSLPFTLRPSPFYLTLSASFFPQYIYFTHFSLFPWFFLFHRLLKQGARD